MRMALTLHEGLRAVCWSRHEKPGRERPRTADRGRMTSPSLTISSLGRDSNPEAIAIGVDEVDFTTPRLV
jgi:hypothetical protein